jgi:hypothetical protein
MKAKGVLIAAANALFYAPERNENNHARPWAIVRDLGGFCQNLSWRKILAGNHLQWIVQAFHYFFQRRLQDRRRLRFRATQHCS